MPDSCLTDEQRAAIPDHIAGWSTRQLRDLYQSIDCPRCGAKAGSACITKPRYPNDSPLRTDAPHSARRKEARLRWWCEYSRRQNEAPRPEPRPILANSAEIPVLEARVIELTKAYGLANIRLSRARVAVYSFADGGDVDGGAVADVEEVRQIVCEHLIAFREREILRQKSGQALADLEAWWGAANDRLICAEARRVSDLNSIDEHQEPQGEPE
jgi:hypothetical protein